MCTCTVLYCTAGKVRMCCWDQHRELSVLLVLQQRREWEARHGGLLGTKYLTAVRQVGREVMRVRAHSIMHVCSYLHSAIPPLSLSEGSMVDSGCCVHCVSLPLSIIDSYSLPPYSLLPPPHYPSGPHSHSPPLPPARLHQLPLRPE